jgi:hypothetical protein
VKGSTYYGRCRLPPDAKGSLPFTVDVAYPFHQVLVVLPYNAYLQYRVYVDQDRNLVKSLNARWDSSFPTEQDLKQRATAKFGAVDDRFELVAVHRVSSWESIFGSTEMEDLREKQRQIEERRLVLHKWEAWCGQMSKAYIE